MNPLKKNFFIFFALLFAGFLFILLFAVSQKKGSIYIHVVDAYTNASIENARIVILENKTENLSDKNGRAFFNGISFTENKYLKKYADYPEGAVTILCYKEGYMDFVLFNASISEVGTNEKTLFMFPVSSENTRTYIAMNETPNDDIAKSILEDNNK